ncbi:MAG: 2-dehydropantoate 2-reductase [Rhodospirillaceae bacterium]|nr:2-dehydropantoate 2-reductase [Rhodospirillaceae bacterium]
MKIGIAGAGAVGGWIGVSMARAGHDISVLARGATLAALQTSPWRLSTASGVLEAKVRASQDAAILGVQDVLVITVKGPALPQLAPTLAPMIGPETIIIPAMNGVPWWFLLPGGGDLPATRLKSVDPAGVIEAAIALPSLIGCVVHASAAVTAPGVVQHKNGRKLIFGEPRGGTTPRLTKVIESFRAAGFEAEASARIQNDIWYKLWGNMTMNPISALTGATCDRILDDALVSGFVLAVMKEAAAIGARIGCEIRERGEDRNQVTRQLGAFKTSMLQDVEAGRPIELDALVAAPREIAQALSIPTPNIDALFGLSRVFGRVRGLYQA